MAARPVLVDDRLLIEELLVGLPLVPLGTSLGTTSYWYYRACRAAVAGAGGHLSGPFADVVRSSQEDAVTSLLRLRADIDLPDPRRIVPSMAALSRRHPRLNLLNLEAVAAATALSATIWLSAESAAGILPGVLDEDGVPWIEVAIA